MAPPNSEHPPQSFDDNFSSQDSNVLLDSEDCYSFIDPSLYSGAKCSSSVIEDEFEESHFPSPSRDETILERTYLHSTPPSGLRTMERGVCRKRRFGCPVFAAQSDRGLPHTCNGISVEFISGVRRHLIRSTRGNPPHLSFLKLCPTCNEDFTNKEIFEALHGNAGQHCDNPKPQRKGAAKVDQWQALYNLVNGTYPYQTDGRTQAMAAPELGRLPRGQSGVSVPQDTYYSTHYEHTLDLANSENGPTSTYFHGQPSPEHRTADNRIRDGSPNGKSLYSLPDSISVSEETLYQSNRSFLHIPRPQGPYSRDHQSEITRYYDSGSETPSSASRSASFYTSEPTCDDPHEMTHQTSSGALNTPFQEDSPNPPRPKKDEVLNTRYCDEGRCSASFTGIYRQGNLARHKRLKHGNHQTTYICRERGCMRRYKRQDARLKHYRKRHPHLAPIVMTSRKQWATNAA